MPKKSRCYANTGNMWMFLYCDLGESDREVFTDTVDTFIQELKHCRSRVTPFVCDQYVRLVQQSAVAAAVNDGRVDGDLFLREEPDWISSLVQDVQFSLKSTCTVTSPGGRVSFKVWTALYWAMTGWT